MYIYKKFYDTLHNIIWMLFKINVWMTSNRNFNFSDFNFLRNLFT